MESLLNIQYLSVLPFSVSVTQNNVTIIKNNSNDGFIVFLSIFSFVLVADLFLSSDCPFC